MKTPQQITWSITMDSEGEAIQVERDRTTHATRELLDLKAKLHRVERELEAALKREREQRTLAEALSL